MGNFTITIKPVEILGLIVWGVFIFVLFSIFTHILYQIIVGFGEGTKKPKKDEDEEDGE